MGTTTQQRGSIEEILRNNPYFIEVLPAEEWPDLILPEGTYPRIAQRVLGVVQQFLGLPYIVDNFDGVGSHRERRRWKEDLTQQHGSEMRNYLDANAMRVNQLNGFINGVLYLLEEYQGERKAFVQEALAWIREQKKVVEKKDLIAPSVYQQLWSPQKLHFVRALKQDAYDALKQLFS